MSERTVLVTGATGLLGREVSAAFGLKNWEVKGTGYSRADGINTFKVDLGNENEVSNFLDETKFVPFSLSIVHILELTYTLNAQASGHSPL